MNLSRNRARAARRGPLLVLAAVAAGAAIAACGGSSSSDNSASSSASSKLAASSGYTLNVGYIGNTGILTGPEGFAYSKGLLQKWLTAKSIAKNQVGQVAQGPPLTGGRTG